MSAGDQQSGQGSVTSLLVSHHFNARFGTAVVAAARRDGIELDLLALPADSPLWDMPNVLVSPHNASASAGNDGRINAIFLDNLKRWRRNEPLVNEVTRL